MSSSLAPHSSSLAPQSEEVQFDFPYDPRYHFTSTFDNGRCPLIPDDVTIPQFLLDDYPHPARPERASREEKWITDGVSGRGWGFDEIRQRVYGLANALKDIWGIGESDVVCIFSPNHIDYPIIIWALHRLGAIATTANPNYTAHELSYQLSLTSSFLLFTSSTSSHLGIALESIKEYKSITRKSVVLIDPEPELSDGEKADSEQFWTLEKLIEYGVSKPVKTFVERRLAPGEGKKKIALLCFSSGTTGRPKAVSIPHYAVIANTVQMAEFYRVNNDEWWSSSKYGPAKEKRRKRMGPGDVAVAVLPFYHIYGLVVNIHMVLFAGMTLVTLPKFDFVQMLDCIGRFGITHLFIVPPQAVLLCKHPSVPAYLPTLNQIRFVMSGAAPLSGEVVEQLVKVLPNAEIGQGYGMTESSTTLTWFPLSQRIGTPGSAGQLLPGVVARVMGENGKLIPRRTYSSGKKAIRYGGTEGEEVGELQVRAPSLALGYWRNEKATNETFVDGGWLRTGDQVQIMDNGDVFVVDRLKEIFKVRGFQVAPAELEGHLLSHPDVNDCCVVGVPDDYSGEVAMAFVVLRDGALDKSDAKEEKILKDGIYDHVKNAKVHYKWLKGGIEFVDSIPKNPSGKLLRRVLREKAQELKRKVKAVRAKL